MKTDHLSDPICDRCGRPIRKWLKTGVRVGDKFYHEKCKALFELEECDDCHAWLAMPDVVVDADGRIRCGKCETMRRKEQQ